jgi:hypothetical protein
VEAGECGKREYMHIEKKEEMNGRVRKLADRESAKIRNAMGKCEARKILGSQSLARVK